MIPLLLLVLAGAQYVEVPEIACPWQCDNPVCHPLCEPVCQEPNCIATCPNPGDTCAYAPVCYTVCPPTVNTSLVTLQCPSCETLCTEIPQSAGCPNTCFIACAPTNCAWRCVKPPVCPKPVCELQCNPPACASTATALLIVGVTAVLPIALCLLLL